MLGIPAYGLRECAKVREDKEKLSRTVQELLVINVCSTVLSYILLIVTYLTIPKLWQYKHLFLIMSLSIGLSTIGLEWVYNALEEYTYITIRSIIFKIVSVILTFLLIHSRKDYVFYGFITIFTNGASYVLNFIHIKKYITFKKAYPYNLKQHIKPIFMLFWASIIITLYANFDVSMIGFISTEREVGLYNAALKIKNIILSLSTAVTAVIIPRIAYYINENRNEDVNKLAEKSLRVSFILALPIAVYVFLFSDDCLELICGKEFIDAQSTLRILMICILPLILTNLFGRQLLIPTGDEKRYSQSVFVGMIVNLALNSIMIPIWGAFGAAFATLITECWNVVWMSGGNAKPYRKYLYKSVNIFQFILPLVGASAGSYVLGIILVNIHVFWRLVITGIAFLGLFFTALYFEREPMFTEELKTILRRLKIIH